MAVVSSLFGAKSPSIKPAPLAATTDAARMAAETDLIANRRRGALANVFAPSGNSDQLGQSTQETTLSRRLGS